MKALLLVSIAMSTARPSRTWAYPILAPIRATSVLFGHHVQSTWAGLVYSHGHSTGIYEFVTTFEQPVINIIKVMGRGSGELDLSISQDNVPRYKAVYNDLVEIRRHLVKLNLCL